MSTIKYLKFAGIFAITLVMGVFWVSAYRYTSGFFEIDGSVPAPVVNKKVTTAPELSMDDEFFTPPQVDETNPDEFDPEGTYTLTNVTKTGFESFDSLSINNKILDVDCDSNEFGDLTKPTGTALLKAADEEVEAGSVLNLKQLNIQNGKLRFVSDVSNDVFFRFDGEFVVKGNFYTLDPDAKVLKGKLSKFVNNKKVYEAPVSFTWSIDLTCVC